MPKSDRSPKSDLTFIVGDPRSRQNLSRIRAHASRATKRTVDVGEPATPQTPASTTGQESKDDHRENEPVASSVSVDSPDPHNRPWTPESDASKSSRAIEPRPPDDFSPASSDNNPDSYTLRSIDSGQRFTTQGSAIGTWWERYPEAQASASGFNQFDPRNRLKVHQGQEERQSSLPGRPGEQSLDDDTQRGDGIQILLSTRAGSRSGSESPQRPSAEEKERLQKKKTSLKVAKQKRSAQQRMQGRWRLGHGPLKSLSLPLDHPLTQFEIVLRQSSDFYHNAFETVWQPLLRQNSTALEAQSDYEMFYESMVSAAALIEAGQVKKASYIVKCIMDMLLQLMYQNHPQAYYFFLDLSLQTSSTALAQLRVKMKKYLLPLAERILGPQHPISQVLRLEVPIAAREQLQTSVMRRVRDFHLDAFGADSNQTISVTFIFARALLEAGQTQHALTLISSAIAAAERAQGMNSLVAVYLIVEKTAIYLSAKPPDTGIIPELHLSDAFRRLQVIEQEMAKLPQNSPDVQKLAVAVTHGKLVGLRMLARLHSLRKNFGAATQMYSQAIDDGISMLGPDTVPVLLAQADLEATKLEELNYSMAEVSMNSKTGSDNRGAVKQSEEEFHIAETALGLIRIRNRPFTGASKEKVERYKGMVVGFTVVGMPTFGHTKVL